MDVVCCICHLILSIYDRNFLSTYSDRKSCHTSTTLQTSITRFVSDSWASCDRNCHFIFSLVLIWCLLGDCYLVRLYCYSCLLYFAVWQQSVLFVCLLACSFLSIKSTTGIYQPVDNRLKSWHRYHLPYCKWHKLCESVIADVDCDRWLRRLHWFVICL